MNMTRHSLYLLLAVLLFVSAACMKTLEKEGIYDDTLVWGQLVTDLEGTPAATVFRIYSVAPEGDEFLVEYTNPDGSFEFPVRAYLLEDGYGLRFEADSLYTSIYVPFQLVGFGHKELFIGNILVDGPTLPVVSTSAPMNVSLNDAICGGNVLENGRSGIRARGVCWGTSSAPSVLNNHSESPGQLGEFLCIMDNLQPGTTYYVRAFATNGVGTAYGEEYSFTTPTGVPDVTTNAVSGITQTSVICGGNITNDYGYTITSRGVCWSTTSTAPTLNDSHTSDGAGAGNFSSSVTGLQSGTHYYIRAYAVNSNGVGYGAVKEFTTF